MMFGCQISIYPRCHSLSALTKQRNTVPNTLSLATLNLTKQQKRRLVLHSSYVHVRPCGGPANRGVAVSRPGLLGGPHASLHPCRMCRWWARLAQNRPGESRPREPGRPRLRRENDDCCLRGDFDFYSNYNHKYCCCYLYCCC